MKGCCCVGTAALSFVGDEDQLKGKEVLHGVRLYPIASTRQASSDKTAICACCSDPLGRQWALEDPSRRYLLNSGDGNCMEIMMTGLTAQPCLSEGPVHPCYHGCHWHCTAPDERTFTYLSSLEDIPSQTSPVWRVVHGRRQLRRHFVR